jgi:hypothetical protein
MGEHDDDLEVVTSQDVARSDVARLADALAEGLGAIGVALHEIARALGTRTVAAGRVPATRTKVPRRKTARPAV